MDLQYNKTDSVVLPITNTRISASEYNQIAGSLMRIISASGLTPDSADNTQLLNALKVIGSGWAMPAMDANNWISLTLGASGTTYTMPEDGLVCFNTAGGVVGGYITIESGNCVVIRMASQTYEVLRASIFIPKGYSFVLNYANAGALQAFGYYKLIGNAN